jgi:hypothetical protein
MGVVDAAQDALCFILIVAFRIDTDIASLQCGNHFGCCLVSEIGEYDFQRKWEAIQQLDEFSQILILAILRGVVAFQDAFGKGGSCFRVKAGQLVDVIVKGVLPASLLRCASRAR